MLITIELSDEEVACLKHDLLDIEQWVRDAVRGKVSKCRERMVRQWTPVLKRDHASLPTDDAAVVAIIRSRADYKDRVAREQEAKEQLTTRTTNADPS